MTLVNNHGVDRVTKGGIPPTILRVNLLQRLNSCYQYDARFRQLSIDDPKEEVLSSGRLAELPTSSRSWPMNLFLEAGPSGAARVCGFEAKWAGEFGNV